MIRAKNNENLSKSVKVMSKILPVPIFPGHLQNIHAIKQSVCAQKFV